MKKYIFSFALILFSGCGPTNTDKTIIPTPIPTVLPKVEAIKTAIPMPSTSDEADITDGKGHVLSTGDGRSIFQRVKKQKGRKVVHQVSKGLFIGGEK